MTKEQLEKEKCELLGLLQGKDEAIKELKEQIKNLEWQLQEVAKDNDNYQEENKRLERENVELKAQIEKMKCCENCVHRDDRDLFPTVDEAEHIPCDDCKRLEGRILSDVLTTDNWKLREIEE